MDLSGKLIYVPILRDAASYNYLIMLSNANSRDLSFLGTCH